MRSDSLDTPRIKVAKPAGRHPEKRLTAAHVRNSAPGRHADGGGLYLVVDDSRAKRWLLRVVVRGRRCDLGLGSVQLVSLAKAREEATRLRRIARSGGDPLEERRRGRIAVPTFKEAATQVHAAHSATFRNAKHKADWLSSLERYAFPHFGKHRVDAITSADVLKALGDIWQTRPETARRLKQRIKVIFDWSKASGHRVGDNPADGVVQVLPRHKGDKEHHAALPWADVPAFVATMRDAEAVDATKLAFEFLILTASRTSEVIGARWEEVDREAKVWTIPKERIKAGREHRVPLSPRCLEILAHADAMRDSGPYVFPGRSPKRTLSNMVFLMLLRRLERDDITAHGFRSSFRDWCEERAGFSRSVVESALAHVVRDKTEAAYLRTTLLEQRRSLMDTWASFVTTPPEKKVVQMRA